MDKVLELLTAIAGELDEQKKTVLADKVDAVANSLLNIKTAQYVGVQGYWLRNGRCWSNCYRQKRASSPDRATWEIWTDCHAEYLASINNDEADWSKYADSNDGFIKSAKARKEFVYDPYQKSVREKIAKGAPLGSAVVQSVASQVNSFENGLIDAVTELVEVGNKLKASDKDLANCLFVAANQIVEENEIKEAQLGNFFRGVGNIGRGLGGAAKDMASGVGQSWNINKQLGAMDKAMQQVQTELNRVTSAKDSLVQYLQTNPGRTPAQQQRASQTVAALNGLVPAPSLQMNEKWQNIRQSLFDFYNEQAQVGGQAAGGDPNQAIGAPTADGGATATPATTPTAQDFMSNPAMLANMDDQTRSQFLQNLANEHSQMRTLLDQALQQYGNPTQQQTAPAAAPTAPAAPAGGAPQARRVTPPGAPAGN